MRGKSEGGESPSESVKVIGNGDFRGFGTFQAGWIRGLEVTVGEGSAGMSFQICFKSIGFFFGGKSNGCFNFPRFEFGGVWDFSGIMFGKAGSQIFRNSGITVRFCGNIDQ